jgi:pentatricopeptide repeat protein
MNARNIAPDTRTYNILMSMSLKQGQTDKILGFYKAMTDAGIVADSFTQSLVLKAYTSSGMEVEAKALADEMMKRDPADHHLANDLLITVYADLGKEEELKKLWKRMSSFSNLSARSYGVMIESLGKLGLIQEAEELATRAERKNGGLVARIYNAMMNVYARHGKMKAAEELLTRIQRDRSRPNAVTYRYLIEGYLKLDHMEKALEYLRVSRENLTFDHSKPWLASFLLVIEKLAEKGDVERAEHTFEAFTTEGPYRSTSIYNALLRAYANAGRKADNFVDRMSKDGFEPDAETRELLGRIGTSTEHSLAN